MTDHEFASSATASEHVSDAVAEFDNFDDGEFTDDPELSDSELSDPDVGDSDVSDPDLGEAEKIDDEFDDEFDDEIDPDFEESDDYDEAAKAKLAAALAQIDAQFGKKPAEQVEAFTDAQQTLQATLARIDDN